MVMDHLIELSFQQSFLTVVWDFADFWKLCGFDRIVQFGTRAPCQKACKKSSEKPQLWKLSGTLVHVYV